MEKFGSVIAIDFGHAFGSATEILPIPELVPFRLTNQIQEFLNPMGEAVFLRPFMTQTLLVLSENRESIMSALDIFIREPLLEWNSRAVEKGKAIKGTIISSVESETSGGWYPRQKLDIAKRKLNLENPTCIFVF